LKKRSTNCADKYAGIVPECPSGTDEPGVCRRETSRTDEKGFI
jgi:hypothetical protein